MNLFPVKLILVSFVSFHALVAQQTTHAWSGSPNKIGGHRIVGPSAAGIRNWNYPWTSVVLLQASPSDNLQKPNDDNKEKERPIVVIAPQATYGVSFMGGDPCGSKYNDDPFDATKGNHKPGIPDDVKSRIAALAEQKKKEMQARRSESQS